MTSYYHEILLNTLSKEDIEFDIEFDDYVCKKISFSIYSENVSLDRNLISEHSITLPNPSKENFIPYEDIEPKFLQLWIYENFDISSQQIKNIEKIENDIM
jgi:hypothetical protein